MKRDKANVKILKLQYSVGVFLFWVIGFFLSSCSSSKYSQSDFNKYLTKERAKAKTSPISFLIPKGWHVVDANYEQFIDLWVVRNDMRVSISLLPFHTDSKNISLKNGYEQSIILQQTKFNNKISINYEKPQTLGGMKVLFYNFKIDKKEYRIALFQFKNKIYELTLFGNNSNIKIEYLIQELFLSSIK